MTRESMLRILISLPPQLKQYLDDVRQTDSCTASGYIQLLLGNDLRARMESGWRPAKGWDTPQGRAYMARWYSITKQSQKKARKARP